MKDRRADHIKHAEFWDIGHKVFKSTPETFPVKFLPGDVFDQSFFTSGSIVTEGLGNDPPLNVAALSSLTPLRGKLSSIHASSFFHLFNEDQQTELAHKLGSLLSPEPGSMIFGSQGSRPQRGLFTETMNPKTKEQITMFCHSAESWVELWEGVFGKSKVHVDATLVEIEHPASKHISDAGRKLYFLVWSVKRL